MMKVNPKVVKSDKEIIGQILRDNITFAPQVDNYVIHGAIDKIMDWSDAAENRAFRKGYDIGKTDGYRKGVTIGLASAACVILVFMPLIIRLFTP